MPPPPQRQMTQEQAHIIDQEIASLLEKKAIERTSSEMGFHRRIFAVSKKDGGWRPVLDFSNLNQYVFTAHFKMESLVNLKDLISQGDYLVKLDLKDAYLTVPMHKESQPYLKFEWRNNTYQCVTLPFGLLPAPYVFTKHLRPVIAHFRKKGGKIMIYIDDLFIIASNPAAAMKLASEVLEFLQSLGFIIN